MALALNALGVTAPKERTFPVGYPLASTIIGPYWRAEDLAVAGPVAELPNHNPLEPYSLLQASAPNQPTMVAGYAPANAKKVLSFPGATQYMEASGFQVAQPYEFWILFQRIAFSSGDFFFELGASSLQAYAQDQAALNIRWVVGGATFNFVPPAAGAASPFIAFRLQSAVGAGASSLTMNNGAPVVGTIGASALATRLILGAKIGGTLNPNFAVAEAFFLRGLAGADEATRNWNYWRTFYGAPIA